MLLHSLPLGSEGERSIMSIMLQRIGQWLTLNDNTNKLDFCCCTAVMERQDTLATQGCFGGSPKYSELELITRQPPIDCPLATAARNVATAPEEKLLLGL